MSMSESDTEQNLDLSSTLDTKKGKKKEYSALSRSSPNLRNTVPKSPRLPTSHKYSIPKARNDRTRPKIPLPSSSIERSVSRQESFTEVKVYLRVRPLIDEEETADFDIVDNKVIARPPARSQSVKFFAERSFTFTKIFDPNMDQKDVFENVAEPMLQKYTRGVDSLLFAYGATNAGKTYTVQGTEENPGLLPSILDRLLNLPQMKGVEKGVFISCVEIYNERIRDLLGEEDAHNLKIGKDGFGWTCVKNCREMEIRTMDEVEMILSRIESLRKTSATRSNVSSSRSHCVFLIKYITATLDPRTGARTNDLNDVKCTRLCIVDLAGSERASATEGNTAAVIEASNINKSMLVLGRCIREIRKSNKGLASKIPFRESKLTELLRDYFDTSGRMSYVSLIINISPSTLQFDDTLFSLQFAAEAVEIHVKDVDLGSLDDLEEYLGEEEIVSSSSEAQIRQEIRAEMTSKLMKIQLDIQNQLEEMRIQSNQPYTAKLQMALAQRLQSEGRVRELSQCQLELTNTRKKVEEQALLIAELRGKLKISESELSEATTRVKTLENNITKLMDGTKKLHERFIQSMNVAEENGRLREDMWQKKVATLTEELERYKQGSQRS